MLNILQNCPYSVVFCLTLRSSDTTTFINKTQVYYTSSIPESDSDCSSIHTYSKEYINETKWQMGYQIQEHFPDSIYRSIEIYLKFIYISKSCLSGYDIWWFFHCPRTVPRTSISWRNTLSVTVLADTSLNLLRGTMSCQNFIFKQFIKENLGAVMLLAQKNHQQD